jgi:hypothetical protein
MTPEQLVQQLQAALADKLKSVVLYGSAATGDFMEGVSGYNLLVVAEPWGTSELTAIAAAAQKWEQAGNPLPQFFTPAELAGSADAFPIEILDMQRSRKILFGADLLAALAVDLANLRMQLEHDLKSKLLFFRQRYLAASQDPTRLAKLLASSLSTFLVLFRAAIKLYDEDVPLHKKDALQKLGTHLAFDASPFLTVLGLKAKGTFPADMDLQLLAGRYLASIEQIVQAIDQHLHPEPQ